MLDKTVYDKMTRKFMDPLKVEKGRLRELRLANKHTTHELVKDDGCTRWSPSTCKVISNKQRQHGQKRTGQDVACEREAECRVKRSTTDSLNTDNDDCFAQRRHTHASRHAPVRQICDGYSSNS